MVSVSLMRTAPSHCPIKACEQTLTFPFFSLSFCLFLLRQYHHISKLVHLPLVLKLWGGRVVLQYLAQFYSKFEGKLMDALCDIETQALEDSLEVEE